MKTSFSSDGFASGGKNGNADENDNLNFIQEEIAPGKRKRISYAMEKGNEILIFLIIRNHYGRICC